MSLHGAAAHSVVPVTKLPSDKPAPENWLKRSLAVKLGHQARYDKAVANGFLGTFSEWTLEVQQPKRKLGGIITTISLEKALKADQFLHFRSTPNDSRRHVKRTLIVLGERAGRVQFFLPSGDDEWLCPYFDPTTSTLRLRQRNGLDAKEYWELPDIAQAKVLRPLLHLAKAEGLLHKIPDGQLSSLNLEVILQSGYYKRTNGNRRQMPVWYDIATERKNAPLRLNVANMDNRQTFRTFPYIDDNQRLRIWDVDGSKPLRIVGHRIVDGGFPAEEVRKRCPKLFAFAQHLGYWKDVI